MKKILILEDEAEKYSLIKKSLEKYHTQFEVFPKLKNGTDYTFNNWGFLMDSIRKKDFQIILSFDHFKDIDLFIVDLTLKHGSSDDRIGVEFLNFLNEINYRNGEFTFLICTRWIPEHIGDLKIEFNLEHQYVNKLEYEKNKFVEVVIEKSFKLLNVDKTDDLRNPQGNEKFFENDNWNNLPKIIEKHILNRVVLLMFYVLIISTAVYALVGTCYETTHNIKMIIQHRWEPTDFLKYVEDVYLFILPLFIVFSFISYYKSTIGIRLTGGDSRDIDHSGAMKSLNNSKFILLSSLLSFTIIKIIDDIFIEGKSGITQLISYGSLLVILITFILIQHKHSDNH